MSQDNIRIQQWQPHIPRMVTRRDFLSRAGAGFGALALSALLAEDAAATSPSPTENESGGIGPHFAPTAKAVIWLFMEGGPSHIDLFDPKPELLKLAGKPLPPSFGRPLTSMGTANNGLLPSKRTFKQHGKSGLWVSDWYPEIARHVDDMAVIRPCWADGRNHAGSPCPMNTGSLPPGR